MWNIVKLEYVACDYRSVWDISQAQRMLEEYTQDYITYNRGSKQGENSLLLLLKQLLWKNVVIKKDKIKVVCKLNIY